MKIYGKWGGGEVGWRGGGVGWGQGYPFFCFRVWGGVGGPAGGRAWGMCAGLIFWRASATLIRGCEALHIKRH